MQCRPRSMELQQCPSSPIRLEIDADRSHVADRSGSATPRTRDRDSARRAGSGVGGSAPRGSSCRCRRVPDTGSLLRGSSPCRRASCRARGMPVDTRSLLASCFEAERVIGSTEMPSLVDQERILVRAVQCVPRYLTMRRRRVDTWSITRWSSRITQSETYSSSPWRVSCAVAALAGDDRGDALVLEPAEQPPQLGAQDRLIREAAEQRLDRVEHDALRADRVDRDAPAG